LPVIIPRSWFSGPVTSTMNRCTGMKPMKAKQKTKCQLRADCRPPTRSTIQPSTESMCGDIASPISTTPGASTKITAR
jgi:hypothetical protein